MHSRAHVTEQSYQMPACQRRRAPQKTFQNRSSRLLAHIAHQIQIRDNVLAPKQRHLWKTCSLAITGQAVQRLQLGTHHVAVHDQPNCFVIPEFATDGHIDGDRVRQSAISYKVHQQQANAGNSFDHRRGLNQGWDGVRLPQSPNKWHSRVETAPVSDIRGANLLLQELKQMICNKNIRQRCARSDHSTPKVKVGFARPCSVVQLTQRPLLVSRYIYYAVNNFCNARLRYRVNTGFPLVQGPLPGGRTLESASHKSCNTALNRACRHERTWLLYLT